MVAATLKTGSSVRVVQTGKLVGNAVLKPDVEATSATVGPSGLSGIVIHVAPGLGAIAVWLLVRPEVALGLNVSGFTVARHRRSPGCTTLSSIESMSRLVFVVSTRTKLASCSRARRRTC